LVSKILGPFGCGQWSNRLDKFAYTILSKILFENQKYIKCQKKQVAEVDLKPFAGVNWPALVEGRWVSKVPIPDAGLAVEQLAESMAHRTLFGAITPLLAGLSASRNAESLARHSRGWGCSRSRVGSRRDNRGWSVHRRWRRRRRRNRTTSTVIVVDIGRDKWGGHTH